MTPLTETDAIEMFEELPRRVQVAILSHMQGLRSRSIIAFTEYPRLVAEYIDASGLMTVEYRQDTGIRFRANAQTQVLRAQLRHCLEIVGVQF